MIQSRTITVVSGQPESSKWWWIGAIRKSRFVETTEHHDLQNHRDGLHHEETTDDRQQEMRTGREGERGEATPIASDPVSPMKIWAGAAFHHRKPMMPPTIAAATTARSGRSCRGSRRGGIARTR